MAKQSVIDRAIASVEKEIAVLQDVLERMRAAKNQADPVMRRRVERVRKVKVPAVERSSVQ